jgi:hypothetical protein
MLVRASVESVTAITVGGALVVAVITAITTNRRQREALNHDRELTDLADLRVLLDEAAIAIEQSHDKFDNLVKRFDEHGRSLPDEPRDELAEAGRVVLALSARLNIRLGENGPVALPFEQAGEEMLKTFHGIHPDDLNRASDDAIEEKLEEMELSKAAFEVAWAEFTTAAVERAGTVETRGSRGRSFQY